VNNRRDEQAHAQQAKTHVPRRPCPRWPRRCGRAARCTLAACTTRGTRWSRTTTPCARGRASSCWPAAACGERRFDVSCAVLGGQGRGPPGAGTSTGTGAVQTNGVTTWFVLTWATLSGCKPSTSLSCKMRCSTVASSRCGGSGSCTRMPFTAGSALSSSILASNSSCVTVAG
jgi:hypothetical protein